MASFNNLTNSFDMNLAICTDPNGGEFEAFETDWKPDIGEFILPFCMLFHLNCLWLVMHSQETTYNQKIPK